MHTARLLFILTVALTLFACQPKPKPISYGTDICHQCKMTIVDKKFAAQAVTDKGKIYNFDAIECLVPFLEQHRDTEFAYIQVKNYLKPEERLDARDAYYVKSPEIPSPMGEYLSAFADRASAEEQAGHPEARQMDWEQLKQLIRKSESR